MRTISLIATASIIAATIVISAFATSAFAIQTVGGNIGQQQSQQQAVGGLVAAGVQAQVQDTLSHNNICVAAVSSHC